MYPELRYKKLILVVLVMMFLVAPQYPIQSRDRHCYVVDTYDRLSSDTYRLYYLAFQSNGYELYYVDQLGQHNTGYSINQAGITARLSPDGKDLLIVYVDSTTTYIEVINLSGLEVKRWTIPSETGVQESPTTAVWVDNQHIGFEAVLRRQLVIQDIDDQSYRIIPYPEIDNFKSDKDFLLFSPNLKYVIYPVYQEKPYQSRNYRMMELSTSSTILTFNGINPVWATNSEYVNFLIDNSELGIANTDGNIAKSRIHADNLEFIQGLSSTAGYAALSAYFIPPPALLTTSILVMDLESHETNDICSYGDIIYTTIGGRFNNQLAIWALEGSQFAYIMHIPGGYRIVVANISEENSVVIVPASEGIPILVGWVST